MAEYKESDVRAFARSLVGGYDAVADGIDVQDTAAAVDLMTKFAAAANEARDRDAFGLHLISEIADVLGDRRVDPPAA